MVVQLVRMLRCHPQHCLGTGSSPVRSPRKIKVGKHIITFKSTTAKRLSAKGKISSMVIQALQELGKEAVTDQVLSRITEVLQQEDKKIIKDDSKLAPAWIASILLSIKT